MVISPTRELAKQINQTSIASDEQVLAIVISPTRELAKQINQTSIASDEQVVAMVTSLTREDCQVDQSNKHCF